MPRNTQFYQYINEINQYHTVTHMKLKHLQCTSFVFVLPTNSSSSTSIDIWKSKGKSRAVSYICWNRLAIDLRLLHWASQLIFNANSAFDDIESKTVVDLGVGCGVLACGSLMLDAGYVLGLDIDPEALEQVSKVGIAWQTGCSKCSESWARFRFSTSWCHATFQLDPQHYCWYCDYESTFWDEKQ